MMRNTQQLRQQLQQICKATTQRFKTIRNRVYIAYALQSNIIECHEALSLWYSYLRNTSKIIDIKCVSYVDGAATGVLVPNYEASSTDNENELSQQTCTPTLRPFTLLLNKPLAANEYVGLTGDSKTLGEWQLDRCVTLNKQSACEWRTAVVLQACRYVNYRYFIYAQDAEGRKQIRRWETHIKPRALTNCTKNCEEPQYDQFGVGAITGEVRINRGWLTNDAIVQLKFDHERMFQIHDIEKFDSENVQIQLVPLNVNPQSGVQVEVTKHCYGDSELKAQQTRGVPYKRGDVIIFHASVPYPIQQSFRLEFYSPVQKLLGTAVVNVDKLVGSEGMLELNILSDTNRTIALLRLPYLIVKPYNHESGRQLDFRTTYAHYWPKSWPSIDIGHRGNGKSYIANPPQERENTMASFLAAYNRHVDMVEFDVHLTSDGVPVIYHDFGLRTAPKGKKITAASQLEYVLIKDVTYEALKQLRVFAIIDGTIVEYPSHNEESRVEHRIFPTLDDLLVELPKSLGFDVEIKWPQRLVAGGFESESEQTIDKNYFVDRVLQTVIKHDCGRPLIFSSFDADICTMLRFKQNIFPVMFLTQGETKKWKTHSDLRTRNVRAAINNAQAFELAGTAPHAEDFLDKDEGAALMKKARDLDQIMVVWGDDCNSKERIKYFTELGASGICYDRTDKHIREGKERGFFNTTALLAEFQERCST